MEQSKQSRRAFLQTSGSLIGNSWIALHLTAILAAGEYACQGQERSFDFTYLTGAEARELEAIAAQIIPTDETPGAREAGVIYFIDRAIGTFMADLAAPLRDGLEHFQVAVQEKFPQTANFSALSNDQQMQALRDAESTPFFGMVRFLTIMGMFANPSYGGNRNKIGWQLLHFEDGHIWQPPFGHYDKPYHTRTSNSGQDANHH